jgi:hypothetical protein
MSSRPLKAISRDNFLNLLPRRLAVASTLPKLITALRTIGREQLASSFHGNPLLIDM